MSTEEVWTTTIQDEFDGGGRKTYQRSGFDSQTGIYHSLLHLNENHKIPIRHDLDTATFVLSQFPPPGQAESRVALIDSPTNREITYAQLEYSIKSLATGLCHGLGVKKGDVVLVLSPNSLLYPTICLAVLAVGAILTTANPLNTEADIVKQVHDSGAKLAIVAPEEVHKLLPTGVPTLVTTRVKHDNALSVEELIENCEPLKLPEDKPTQSDTAAILYSSGTTGVSKGVILTHANFISTMTLLKWAMEIASSQNDAMLEAIQNHKVSNVPAVPPVILGLVKYDKGDYDLSSLRRVGSGAAPLSKEVADGFRRKFPWVELRPGYGLTESCAATSFFPYNEQAKMRPGSSGMLLPCVSAKVVDVETGLPLPPYKEGELWLKSPGVMKGYLGNEEATAATIDRDRWLKTGDLCFFDEDGYLYIVDRIKELIKHNGYQVAPAELEAILLSHPNILDAAVIPLEDEATGEIPMAYVVRASGDELTEDQVIQFVAKQVAPYKKVRKVSFINAIPRSAAGKILRKELVSQSKQKVLSKL